MDLKISPKLLLIQSLQKYFRKIHQKKIIPKTASPKKFQILRKKNGFLA